MRYIFLEVVLPLIIFLFVRSILRNVFGAAGTAARTAARPTAAPPQPTVVAGGELKKDPVCGTYVSTALSVTRSVDGQLVHFCSKSCRDKYRAA